MPGPFSEGCRHRLKFTLPPPEGRTTNFSAGAGSALNRSLSLLLGCEQVPSDVDRATVASRWRPPRLSTIQFHFPTLPAHYQGRGLANCILQADWSGRRDVGPGGQRDEHDCSPQSTRWASTFRLFRYEDFAGASHRRRMEREMLPLTLMTALRLLTLFFLMSYAVLRYSRACRDFS